MDLKLFFLVVFCVDFGWGNLIMIQEDGSSVNLIPSKEKKPLDKDRQEDEVEEPPMALPANSTINEVLPVKETRQGCQYSFTFERVGQTAVLQSPRYPEEYPPNTDCKYFISSPQGSVIDMDCDDFNLESSTNCQYDIFYMSLSGDRCALYSESQGVFCGCSIISQKFVLTAAHCTHSFPQNEPMYVDIGDHDLTSNTESANRVIRVDRVIENALYNDRTKDNDIALLELSEMIQFTRNIQPVCLPFKYRDSNFDGSRLWASGWGTTSFGGPQSMVLQHVNLPYMSTEACRDYYRDAITNNMFCTYEPKKDTCQGDSGGSLDFKESGSGRYYAIGLTSWGVGCGSQNQPGVYAKISNYLNWIEGNSGETFCKI